MGKARIYYKKGTKALIKGIIYQSMEGTNSIKKWWKNDSHGPCKVNIIWGNHEINKTNASWKEEEELEPVENFWHSQLLHRSSGGHGPLERSQPCQRPCPCPFTARAVVMDRSSGGFVPNSFKFRF